MTTPDAFWNTVFEAQEVGSMVDKYAWLRQAVLDARGPVPAQVLREAARRWPGSLRECQRVRPDRYRVREQWARDGLHEPERAYAAWLAEGRAAICLWSELHRCTAEVLAWRASASAARRGDGAAFLRDLTRKDPGRRAAWPEEAVLTTLTARGVGAGMAERCVAHRAGWDRARLRTCLLGLEPEP